MQTLERPEPLRLSEWAAENFYLSAESSYVEGRWEAYPYQTGMMDCISNDDIHEVTLIKSARVGYTKMILAAMGYFAEHKRRNQAMWQPVDDDRDEFVKTELEPMIRDVKAVQKIFPWYNSRSKYNTLQQKVFIGSILHLRGGKAAKNYRRLSVDVAYLDELDGFDTDVESEGDPVSLAAKRIEGASFPKLVCGSTPRLADLSLIESRTQSADLFMRYHIPCPHCSHYQALYWGGRDVHYGFRWEKDHPETAAYLCEACAALFTQGDYLKVWTHGQWQAEDGRYLAQDGRFYSAEKQSILPPRSIAFHVWTAYSPQAAWATLVSDWLRAQKDPTRLKAFVNTTLGEVWREQSEKSDPATLLTRRENYTAARLPREILYLTAGVDCQDDRLELEVIGWRQAARDEPPESWGVEYQVLRGDPARNEVWTQLDTLLQGEWRCEDNRLLRISAACIDSGGHHTAQVYAFCEARKGRHIYAIKGMEGARPVWSHKAGKSQKYKAQVWHVGSDTAKDAWYARLRIAEPGPGYCHFPVAYDAHYFDMLTAEQVRTKYRKGRPVREWFCPPNRRNEALDCFDEETEVLTDRGWMRFSSLNQTENLATVNLDFERIEYQKPSHYVSRHHQGKMLHIQGRRIDIMVTENHRMVAIKKRQERQIDGSRKWNLNPPVDIVLAKDLTLHHQLLVSAQWEGIDHETIKIPAYINKQGNEIWAEEEVDAGDFAEFLGWFVSEGCSFVGKSKKTGHINCRRVQFDQNPVDKAERLDSLLRRLPWAFRTERVRTSLRWIITNAQLYDVVVDCGIGVANKKVPQWIKDSSPRIIKRFLESAILGDGWQQETSTATGEMFRTYVTISRQLADDMQELFIKTGNASNIKIRQLDTLAIAGRSGTVCQPQYHVSELRGRKASLDGGENGKRKFIGEWVDYDGMVYCATVPNGTLICRRNGRSFIAGNCRVYALAALLSRPINWTQLANMPSAPVSMPAPKAQPKSGFINRPSGQSWIRR